MKNKRIVTTSWDDGHKLDLKLAKLLKKYGIAATFYISLNSSEFAKKDLLTNEQIKQLSRDFEIGAHTLTHPNLVELPIREAQAEITGSKKYLEKLIGKKITSFCYPYGEFNLKIERVVKEAGFKLARTIERFQTKIGKNPYTLPTTAHAYSHLLDLTSPKLLRKYKSIRWEKIAKREFDEFLETGGVFHLWGHSWEIEKYKDWKKLEELFKYMGKRQSVAYLSNSEAIK